MPLTDRKVVGVVGRCDLDAACPKVLFNVVVRDDRSGVVIPGDDWSGARVRGMS